MKLPYGKVPLKVLEEVIFSYLGAKRKDVVVGPSFGLDGAVIQVGDSYLVTSMDPITGALERIGWLAVNINANDVATFGVKPAFFSSCILLPENSTEGAVETICRQIDSGAKKLDMAVVGGHAETTLKLPFQIVIGCCMGLAENGRYVTSQQAKAGNKLVMTKTAGIEGTAILSADRRAVLAHKLDENLLRRAESFYNRISVVKEALLAFETGFVTAMHDPTECGVAGGIHEIADASKLGFRVYRERISIAEETRSICKIFKIDPLQLVASGSLIIAVENSHAQSVVQILMKNKINATVIGEFLPSPEKRVIVAKDGGTERLNRPLSDHLWSVLRDR